MMYLPLDQMPCKEDSRWSVPTPGELLATEIEVMECLYGLVRAVKPQLIVETGCYLGHMTRVLAAACDANGGGRVVSCDIDHECVMAARKHCNGWYRAIIRECPALELDELYQADFLFIDSSEESRLREIEVARKDALIVMHDTVTNERLRAAAMVMPNAAFIRTARGLTIIGRP